MTTKKDTAPAVTKTQDQIQWAAGYYLTPSRLAGQRVRSYGVGVLGGAVFALSVYVGAETGLWVALIPGAIVAIGATIYAVSVIQDVENVRRQLWLEIWAQERTTGEDIDGDGIVGPPVGHVVEIGGGRGSVTLPNIDVMDRRPLVHFPSETGHVVTPDDVLHILDRAVSIGLGFRNWERHKLPSGTIVDRTTWAGCQDGLIAWRFAQDRQTQRGRVVELRGDLSVEDMKRAVRLGAREQVR